MTGVSSESAEPNASTKPARRSGGAAHVALGILVSRLFGIVRQMLTAKYLGASAEADAFWAAFKVTNFLQNLFGEGALSASFIPVYSGLVKEDPEEAGRVAGAVGALLGLIVAVIVLIGIIATPALIPLIAQGFDPKRRELTILLTRILFPGAGIFVTSAWCLGILNTHRRFLLSYLAPVFWNLVMIAALVVAGPRQSARDLASTLAWASVVGALLQFLVQVPSTLRLGRPLRIGLDTRSPHVRTVMRNFGPAFISRGVVQISSYIDNWLATFLPLGMVATFGYASAVIVLPVSLFGMSVSAAQLPEMSAAGGGDEEVASYLRGTLTRGLRQIAYFVVPSAAAFLAFGDVIAALLFQRGRFTRADSLYAWGILAGASVGLLASTMGRLYSSTYYALKDTRTPLRFAVVRVALTTLLGYLLALWLPQRLGIDRHWGAAGLTVSAGIAGWIEFSLLRSRLNQRIGSTGIPGRFIGSLWGAAVVASIAGWEMRRIVSGRGPVVGGMLVLGTYGVIFLLMTVALGVPEAHVALARVRRGR
jgi:putative peptidoglycan lipid II flippase